jgi:hypothetical protein
VIDKDKSIKSGFQQEKKNREMPVIVNVDTSRSLNCVEELTWQEIKVKSDVTSIDTKSLPSSSCFSS